MYFPETGFTDCQVWDRYALVPGDSFEKVALPVAKKKNLGVIAMKVTDRTGPMVSAGKVVDSDELLIISSAGMIIRTKVSEISSMGRSTQGVKVINLREGDRVTAIEVISEEEGDPVSELLFEDDDEVDKKE